LKKVKIKLKSKRKEKNTTNNTYSLGRDKKSNERIYNNKIIVMKQGTMRRNPKVTKKTNKHIHICVDKTEMITHNHHHETLTESQIIIFISKLFPLVSDVNETGP
jgi:hypothetical protein